MDSFYEERICTGDEYSRESILEALVGIGVGVSHSPCLDFYFGIQSLVTGSLF